MKRLGAHDEIVWSTDILQTAARNGHLHILEHAWRPRWTSGICTAAAKAGHLDILKWLRQKRCPWDQATFQAAFANRYRSSLS